MLTCALSGSTGRMGKAIQRLIQTMDNVACVGSVFDEQYTFWPEVCEKADVIIDFSTPEATQTLLKSAQKPIIIGTTGHTSPLVSSFDIPVLYAPNTSLGVQILKKSLLSVSSFFQDAEIEVIETHHKHKRDKPSGTALSLKKALQGSVGGYKDIPIHSVRGGGATGEHEIRIFWDEESISFSHRSFSRDVYARGAIKLAFWLKDQKPGLYSVEDAFA